MDKKTEKNPNLTEPFMHKVRELVPHLPSYITTYNLTLSSALWSIMVIYGAYKSQKNINWLYLSAIGIFFHIITDALDGAVGRYRNTGAVKWGYFMDHTMDALIMISIAIGFALVLPQYKLYILILFGLEALLFITAHLSLDDNGLDISTCYKGICFGATDTLFLQMFLFLYLIYTKGKLNKYFLIVLSIVLVVLNIMKIYEKQEKSHKIDQEKMKK